MLIVQRRMPRRLIFTVVSLVAACLLIVGLLYVLILMGTKTMSDPFPATSVFATNTAVAKLIEGTQTALTATAQAKR